MWMLELKGLNLNIHIQILQTDLHTFSYRVSCDNLGSKGSAVVRALASHQCGPGSNPSVDAICGLSLLLVLSFAPTGFSPGSPVFPSPQKPTFPNSNSTRNQVDEGPLCGCATSKSLFIYLFIYFYLFICSKIKAFSFRWSFINFILINCSFNYVLVLLGEYWFWSLWGLTWLIESYWTGDDCIKGAVSWNSAKLGNYKCLLNYEKHKNNRLKL